MPHLSTTHGEGGSLALPTHKVLRNTYLLLAMTLVNSALSAALGMWMGFGHGVALGLLLLGFVMLFALNRCADRASGIGWVFAFTAVMGAALGPTLNHYLALDNGPALVLQALGGTALVFLALSAYVLVSRKDFSFMGGFLLVGLLVMIAAMIANLFLQIPLLSVAISAGVVLLMSGFILFDTSRIIHGGETNYVRATVDLYLNIYNLFIHLLHLMGLGSD